ncbi:TonB-dependent receptor [Teredinibacter purpureus]|uniref:TonB-dependent receptor n=1 Tax=Teredinibacter purpureus TaxID=2731756 RepID=UPI0005F7EFC3|nr:TonB-dependent receptor [Teredinibacter purpureus]
MLARMVRLAAIGSVLWCGAFYSVRSGADVSSIPNEKQFLLGMSFEELRLIEVVVTVQKKEEGVQETPISVAVASGDSLVQQGITDLAALQGFIPGVQFQPVGDTLATIRGLGTYTLEPGVDSAISFNLDGIYLASPGTTPPVFFDLSRVEIMRGPQGTLFGRNSNAGAINIVTNKPVREFEGLASVQVGNNELLTSEFVINTPLNDDFTLRAAMSTVSHEGYKKSGHDDKDQYAGRVHLLYSPVETFSFLGTVDYSMEDSMGGGEFSPCPPKSSAFCTIDWEPFSGPRNPSEDDFRKVSNTGFYGEARWEADRATWVSVSNYRALDSRRILSAEDPFGGVIMLNPESSGALASQEVRVESPASNEVLWVLGVYRSSESRDYTFNNDLIFADGLPLLDQTFSLENYSADSSALFAQLEYPVTSSVRTILGLRYTVEQKVMLGGIENSLTGDAYTIDTESDHAKLTWKAGLEYDIAENARVFGSVSTGFKSGGASMVPSGFELPETYEPEEITAYQLGVKSRFKENRIQLNAEAFYYDYTGLQNLTPVNSDSTFFFTTANSQKTVFQGGEIETAYVFDDASRLGVALAYLDAEYTEFELPGLSLSGGAVRSSPPLTANISYDKVFKFLHGSRLLGHIEWIWFDEQWASITNSPNALQESYGQTAASVTYQSASKKWDSIFWVRNLENNAVIHSVFADAATVYPPRSLGVSIRRNFQ